MIPSSVGGVFLLANCYAQVNYLLNVPNWMIYFELSAETLQICLLSHTLHGVGETIMKVWFVMLRKRNLSWWQWWLGERSPTCQVNLLMLLTGLNICTISLHAWLVDWQTFGQEPFIEWKEEKTTVTFSFRFIDFSSCLFHECGCILSAWTFIVYRPPCLIPIMISCV